MVFIVLLVGTAHLCYKSRTMDTIFWLFAKTQEVVIMRILLVVTYKRYLIFRV